jgi:subtilisin family serine protease
MRKNLAVAGGVVLLVVATLLVPARASDIGADEPENPGVTVVAVIDSQFNPYHYDFLGSQHPWNLDADPTNDIDFTADPAGYIEGFPGATPLPLTLPTTPDQDISRVPPQDQAVWEQLRQSTADDVKLYRFPGTKVVGAAWLDHSPYQGNNEGHGTRAAAVAAGNLHGTCPECVFVLIAGKDEAVKWAASQPWIDVVTNSWAFGFTPAQLATHSRARAPIEATRAAVEAGQTIAVASLNQGFWESDRANSPLPEPSYLTGDQGPDWMVTVGSISADTEQTFTAAGKPVDISSYGEGYPSSGGTTATGESLFNGTSNATPVVAGTIARVIQKGRELLHDKSEGHRDGVVASGHRFRCGRENPSCPLGDGVLLRAEAQATVFQNVLPSPPVIKPTHSRIPSTEYSYAYQGHGVVYGRMPSDKYANKQQRYLDEQKRFLDVLRGDATSRDRPPGEQNWMTVDSKCRQRLWGMWTGGYYHEGVEPSLHPVTDPLATTFNAWCSAMPKGAWDKAYYG